MNVGSWLLQRFLDLGPPTARDLIVQRDLRVPMPDGVDLLTDRWAPRVRGGALPTAVVRTPYGRGLGAAGVARPLAERGYQVLIQSTRGTFGSGGEFDPLRQEREDGVATLEWVVKQDWFGGSIVLVGTSYMGYAQWAIADRLPSEVKAMIVHMSESALTLELLREDGLSLETPFNWAVTMDAMARRWPLVHMHRGGVRARRALSTLPLNRADVVAMGHRSPYVQDVLALSGDDARWSDIDHRHRVANVTVPVSSVGGWYDLFLPGQLRDFCILQAAGHPARLTVGPWTHLSLDATAIKEAVEFGRACTIGDTVSKRAPVRLFVMGQEAWRDFDTWPPTGYEPQRFYLQPGGGLGAHPPDRSVPDTYHYNPNDPTPAVGGVRMDVGRGIRNPGGRHENSALEARTDVLTYTTDILEHDLEVIGEVSAEIWFCSTLPYADVFVRLCDVDPKGRSYNVCDGLVSVSGADYPSCARVALWPTAHCFARGHRLRIQVSSGAFPRYARNPGTGESQATAVTLRVAEQEVYHDLARPSAVTLSAMVVD